MVRFQIQYKNKWQKRSDRARMALDLKKIYWGDRERPKDWYWFEGNIEIISVPDLSYDCLIVECKHMDDAWSHGFRDGIADVLEIDALLWEDKGQWLTSYVNPD